MTSRTPNNRLRYERELRGWSQSKVAGEIGTNTDRISRWESGESAVSPHYREKLCILFHKNAVELGLLAEASSGVAANPAKKEVSPGESTLNNLAESNNTPSTSLTPQSIQLLVPSGASVTIQVHQQTPMYGDEQQTSIHSPITGHNGIIERRGVVTKEASTESSFEDNADMNRREAIKVTGQIVGATLLIPRQELLSRLSIALNRPSRLDLTTLHHLEILTAGYWKLLPDITGIVSGDLLRFVLGHLENVTTLLESVQPITLHKRLCCMASETSQIAGRMLYEMHNFAAAEAYYHISIEAAQQSGNHALWAVALGHMGFLRTYNGQPHLAIPFLQEAHRLAAQSATGTTRSWLAAVEAEAQANICKLNRDFNTTLCFRALEKAELASNPEKPGEDPYLTGFNHTRQEGYKGVCYVLLHQTDAALAVLNKALGNLDPSSTYPRSVILTDLGTVHVQREEIEEACKYGGQALAITAESKSPIVLQRLFAFRRQLNAWKNVSEVIQFDEQMRFVAKQVMSKAS